VRRLFLLVPPWVLCGGRHCSDKHCSDRQYSDRHCSDKQYSSMALSHLRDYSIIKFFSIWRPEIAVQNLTGGSFPNLGYAWIVQLFLSGPTFCRKSSQTNYAFGHSAWKSTNLTIWQGHLGALYPIPWTDHHQILMRCCFHLGQHSCQNSPQWVQPFVHNARVSRQRTDRRQNLFWHRARPIWLAQKSTNNW